MQDIQKFDIKTTKGPFKCPVCGKCVRSGENYLEKERVKTCFCALPARKLIPLSEFEKLEAKNRCLELQNLNKKLDLCVLTSYPEGEAAKKIIKKYISKRQDLLRIHIESQN
jgi:hypothetical protein